MQVTSTSFRDGGAIPPALAFCKLDPATHATLSDNRSPQLGWSGAPAGTKSFAMICHDPDVPSRGDDVNQEGRVVPKSLPRVDFFHWVLVDLPASVTGLAEGEFASSVTAKGKPGPAAAHGARQGINDYTGWFAGDKDMGGNTSATTARAPRGTTRSRTTTCSRCTRSTSRSSRWKAPSRGRRCARRSRATCSRRRRSPGCTRSTRP